MACKYDCALEECKSLTSSEIIEKYNLTDREIQVMKYLYHNQYRKEDIIDNFYYIWNVSKSEVSKVVGCLKKKGLTYSVIDLNGWLGTEIKI